MSSDSAFVTRRGFLKGTALAASGLALAAGTGAAAQEAPAVRVPTAMLGRTGVEVSRLGIGCAPFQRPHLTIDDVRATLFRALDLGVTYLDVAPNYGVKGNFSEEKMGPTIKEIRDKVFLVTKTEEPTYEGVWKSLRLSMERMQTDHLDLVHLHNFGNESRFEDLPAVFGDQGALGALREARKQGVIRFIGATGHLYPSRFHKALDTGEIDVLMNAVNFVSQHVYDFESKVWARAHLDNVGLVAMKVLGGEAGGGKRFRIPAEHYEMAIRYSLSIPGCACSVIGCENIAELEQAARVVAGSQPLTDEERVTLAKAGLELSTTEGWPTAYGNPLT